MSGLSLSSTKLEKAYSWELPLAIKEDELYNKKLRMLKPDEGGSHDLWKEVIEELYLQKKEEQK
jgi:hypothetical protein